MDHSSAVGVGEEDEDEDDEDVMLAAENGRTRTVVVLSIGRRLVGASRAISIAASVIVSIVRIVSVRMVVVGMVVLLLLLLAILETLVVSMTLGALSLVVAAAVAVNQLVTAIVSTRVVVLDECSTASAFFSISLSLSIQLMTMIRCWMLAIGALSALSLSILGALSAAFQWVSSSSSRRRSRSR